MRQKIVRYIPMKSITINSQAIVIRKFVSIIIPITVVLIVFIIIIIIVYSIHQRINIKIREPKQMLQCKRVYNKRYDTKTTCIDRVSRSFG